MIIAARERDLPMVMLLLHHPRSRWLEGSLVRCVFFSLHIKTPDLEIMNLLAKHGLSLEHCGPETDEALANDQTSLHELVRENNIPWIRFLEENGCRPIALENSTWKWKDV